MEERIADPINPAPLVDAAGSGNLPKLRKLLAQKPDLGVRNESGDTALHAAVRNGRRPVVRLLLQQKELDLLSRDAQGLTSLHLAATVRDTDLITLLLNAGVPIDIRATDQSTPLQLAAESQDPRMVQLLVEQKADVHLHDVDGRTALHRAAKAGDADAVQTLLAAKADPQFRSLTGVTPLHEATSDANALAAGRLMRRMVAIDVADDQGTTSLHLAVASRQAGVAWLLLQEGADPNASDLRGLTPVHMAARVDHLGMIESLVAHGADLKIVEHGRTAVHFAAQAGSASVIDYLFNAGLHVDDADENGDTPLLMAYRAGQLDAIKHLRFLGARKDPVNHLGQNVVHQAAASGSMECLKLALADTNFVGINDEVLNARNIACKGGRLPAHYAAESNSIEALQLVMTQEIMERIDSEGRTPLFCACQKGSPETTFYLLGAGACQETPNPTARKAVHYAALGGSVETLKMVLTDRNIEDKESRGLTPLLLACSVGALDIVLYLLEQKVDTSNVDIFFHRSATFDDCWLGRLKSMLNDHSNSALINGTPSQVACWRACMETREVTPGIDWVKHYGG